MEVLDDRTLLIASTIGYGSLCECISYEFADDGSVASVRAGSGTTGVPIDVFRGALQGRSSVGVGDPVRP